MKPWMIVLIVIAVVLTALVIVLYFLGKKAQKRQQEQQEMLEANKQTVSMLIIDKKRMRLKDAGLPQIGPRPDAEAYAKVQNAYYQGQNRPADYVSDL